MNDVERTLLECMENDKFKDIISDNFDFADALIEKRDIERIFGSQEELSNADDD